MNVYEWNVMKWMDGKSWCYGNWAKRMDRPVSEWRICLLKISLINNNKFRKGEFVWDVAVGNGEIGWMSCASCELNRMYVGATCSFLLNWENTKKASWSRKPSFDSGIR